MEGLPKDFKLLVDPYLKKGQQKLVRYCGESYNNQGHICPQVIVSDPRLRYSKIRERPVLDLRIPRYKIDENSTDNLPPLEITFSNLNDNITEDFIKNMCMKYGELERVKIYKHPKTSQHLGLAKVIFTSIKSASLCIKSLDGTPVMGNVISAVIDSKGDELKRLFNRIVHGKVMVRDSLPDVIRNSQEACSVKRNEPKRKPSVVEVRRTPEIEKIALNFPVQKPIQDFDARQLHKNKSDTNHNDVIKSAASSADGDSDDATTVKRKKSKKKSKRSRHKKNARSKIEEAPVSRFTPEDLEDGELSDGNADDVTVATSPTHIKYAPHSNIDMTSRSHHLFANHQQFAGRRIASPPHRDFDRLRHFPPAPDLHFDPHHTRITRSPPRSFVRPDFDRRVYRPSSPLTFTPHNDYMRRARSPHRFPAFERPPQDRFREFTARPPLTSDVTHPEAADRFQPPPTIPHVDVTSQSPAAADAVTSSPPASADEDERPQLTLDERLREMVGEGPAPTTAPVALDNVSSGCSEVEEAQPPSAVGSVDMDISSGESEHLLGGVARPPALHPPMTSSHDFGTPPAFPVRQQRPNWPGGNSMWPPPFPQRFMMGQRGGPWPHIRNEQPRFGHRLGPPPPHRPHPNLPPTTNFPPRPNYPPQPPPRPQFIGPDTNGRIDWSHRSPWPPNMPPNRPQFGYIFPRAPFPAPDEPRRVLTSIISNNVAMELKEIVKRDLMKKMVETIAFRQFENWFDRQQSKSKLQVCNEVPLAPAPSQPAPAHPPSSALTFDPLDWAKGGSLSMNGFRLGVSLKFALSGMPSFRVKKPQLVTNGNQNKLDKDFRLNRKKDDVSDDVEAAMMTSKRNQVLELDSDGEMSEMTSSDDDAEDEYDPYQDKRVPLDVDEVFSPSDDDITTEDDQSNDSDVTDDEIMKSGAKKRRLLVSDDDVIDFNAPNKKLKMTSSRDSDDVINNARSDDFVAPDDEDELQPGRRFRYYSKDESKSNLDFFADVTERVRSDSESHLHQLQHLDNKQPLDGEKRKQSEDELQAVMTLLSFHKAHHQVTSSPHEALEQQRRNKRLEEERKDQVFQIAEEHSYANPLPKDIVLIDHNYSLSPKLYQERTLHPAARMFPSTTISTERVKSRREKKPDVTSSTRSEVLPRKRFERRSEASEHAILMNITEVGIDLEDMMYIRMEFEEMLKCEDGQESWVNDTHWVPHPVTKVTIDDGTPSGGDDKLRKRGRKRKRKDDVISEPHKTGCARSEGYYKLNAKVKRQQRSLMCRQADNTIPRSRGLAGHQGNDVTTGSGSTMTSGQTVEKSREARHIMRRIASEFGAETSDLIKYNQLMYRKKSVKFKRSRIHGWGLFAEETIAADEMVIEYVGQLVRSLVADRREMVYTKRGIGSSYLFRIDQDHIIDATKCGNFARFMNHSCNPSCYAKVITVDGNKKIVIYSKDVIKAGEEITYDYKFPIEDEKIPCFCGSFNCRGTLN